MNAEAIQSVCIDGTKAYLKFLEDNDRGLHEILVHRIDRIEHRKKRLFKLALAERLFDPECVSLKLIPPNQMYGPDCFEVEEYDGDAKTLIIQVKDPGLRLEERTAESLRVVSDLRFLVRNVIQWYEENGRQLQLPAGKEPVDAASSGQPAAVETALQNSPTYIWGPPGTGKTRHVLPATTLQLLRDKKKIGIFAATNNALEQAMEALVREGKKRGLAPEKFLRVGHPSARFANDFPKVCEVRGLEKQIGERHRQVKNYGRVLEHRRGATVLNSAETLRSEIHELPEQLERRRKLFERRAHLRRNLLSRMVHRAELRTLDEELKTLERAINGQLELIRSTETESDPLNEIIKKIDFTNVERAPAEIEAFEHGVHEWLKVNRALAEEYEDQETDAIQREKDTLERELEVLESQTIPERIKAALVTGMTLDCFIGRFHDTFLPFDHVFLDEAGYAPLVKALTLCRKGIPLTFLGDHKQLGPVCEMDDENLSDSENKFAILWRKSALFLDEMYLSDEPNVLLAHLFEKSEPALKAFAVAKLNETYRFGQNLADILSECVYGFGLVAQGRNQVLEIIPLNAVPSQEPVRKRENEAEVEAIASYLHEHPEIDDPAEETFAILAPYKNQVTLLSKKLVQARREGRIMTIHKSQGREWDTVFLSVADGRYNRPWFTDTTNPQSGGLFVMNTAVSRARKRLVLVCDKGFWTGRESQDQLIGRILRASCNR